VSKKDKDRVVAVKCVDKMKLSPKDLSALKRETRILRQLDHPNIIRMHECFETDKVFYIVTDFVPGEYRVLDEYALACVFGLFGLCCVVFCYVVLGCAMLSCAMLCCAILCFAVLCHVILCCAVLVYDMLGYVFYSMICHAMLCYPSGDPSIRGLLFIIDHPLFIPEHMTLLQDHTGIR
jgi:hypothetical protein